MGQHRTGAGRSPVVRKGATIARSRRITEHPPLPNNIGKSMSWRNIRGVRRSFQVVDEIRRVQSDAPNKVICLQMIACLDDGRTELRLGYYMIGVKPRMAGKWTWGQFATLMPVRDFRAIVKTAERRGWL